MNNQTPSKTNKYYIDRIINNFNNYNLKSEYYNLTKDFDLIFSDNICLNDNKITLLKCNIANIIRLVAKNNYYHNKIGKLIKEHINEDLIEIITKNTDYKRKRSSYKSIYYILVNYINSVIRK